LSIRSCLLLRTPNFELFLTMIRPRYLQVLEAGERGEDLPSDDLALLLSTADGEETEALFRTADRVRQRSVGDEVHLRGIVEFSNTCIQNCLYCGLRKDNHRLRRYRMAGEEIIAAVKEVKAKGLRTVVLQSGEDPWFTKDRLSDLILRIKEETGLTITLSVGERSEAEYRAWKECGADRYLLKQETSSADLFAKLRPGRRLTERLDSLNALRRLGYEVGSGNMVGLPGQREEDLVRDIQLFRESDFDMIGVGPFIPHPQTPLAEAAPGDLRLTLKILAITRMVTRNTNLPATTAAGVLDPEGRRKALLAGANVIMPNITPQKFRKDYEIYPGKTQPDGGLDSVVRLISSLGRKVSQNPGYRRPLPDSGKRSPRG
jgi:biotin synthase